MDPLLAERSRLKKELEATDAQLRKALERKKRHVQRRLRSVARQEALLRGDEVVPDTSRSHASCSSAGSSCRASVAGAALPSARVPPVRINSHGNRSPRDSHDVSTLICLGGKHDMNTIYRDTMEGPAGYATARRVIGEANSMGRSDNARTRGQFSKYLDASIKKNVNIKASNHLG